VSTTPKRKAAPKKKRAARRKHDADGLPKTGMCPLNMIVGQNVRRTRTELKISQRGLCRLCGLSQRHLSQIETTGSNLTLETLYLLSQHLNATPIALLTPPST
jgi:DNA-binding Xre family transcriptional regulator